MPPKFERRNELIANNHFDKKKKEHSLAKVSRETSFNNLGSKLKGSHLLAMGWQNLAP